MSRTSVPVGYGLGSDVQMGDEIPDYDEGSASEHSFVVISEIQDTEPDEALTCAAVQSQRDVTGAIALAKEPL